MISVSLFIGFLLLLMLFILKNDMEFYGIFNYCQMILIPWGYDNVPAEDYKELVSKNLLFSLLKCNSITSARFARLGRSANCDESRNQNKYFSSETNFTKNGRPSVFRDF